MNENGRPLPLFLVIFYAWISAVFFGGILLDVAYSKELKNALDTSNSAVVFSDISDILLLIGAVVILAAVGAIAFSWNLPAARNLLIASLITISLEFSIPLLFSQLIQDAQMAGIGPWLRILPSAAASILAFIGLYGFYRGK